MTPTAVTKPRLRGVSHEVAFFMSLVAGALLVGFAGTREARIAAAVYALSLAAMFGASALYHRPAWGPTGFRRMRRLDHGAIFVFIAGTCTPLLLLGIPGRGGHVVLAVIWIAAGVGFGVEVLWSGAPRALRAAIHVAVGWTSLWVLPALYAALGVGALALVIAGGLLYTGGAVVYAVRRPDPLPRAFGYHEVFHALVVAASVCHLVVVSRLVLAG